MNAAIRGTARGAERGDQADIRQNKWITQETQAEAEPERNEDEGAEAEE